MSEEILINVTPRETRVGVVENGMLQEVHVERASKRGYVGNIYKGRVQRVMPGMQAVFVEIGLKLKKESPFAQHFTISLANGYNGYLPTAEHHKLGGYETWRARSSFLEVDAEAKIREKILELLKQVAA